MFVNSSSKPGVMSGKMWEFFASVVEQKTH
jgi:hypothetical protein